MPTSDTIKFVATCALLISATACFSQNFPNQGQSKSGNTTQLAPFAADSGSGLNSRWQFSAIPGNKIPPARFEWGQLADQPALKLHSERAYGVLTHAWQGPAPVELAWRWHLARPLSHADITTKAGDDAALKVCVMFKQPLSDIPFFQRAALSLARTATGQDLPNATLCYLWDSRYPAGTAGANPYTARVRYIVLTGSETPPGQWVSQRRRIADDFAQMFGAESQHLPPVIAVAVGADSDNTQDTSTAYIADLRWIP